MECQAPIKNLQIKLSTDKSPCPCKILAQQKKINFYRVSLPRWFHVAPRVGTRTLGIGQQRVPLMTSLLPYSWWKVKKLCVALGRDPLNPASALRPQHAQRQRTASAPLVPTLMENTAAEHLGSLTGGPLDPQARHPQGEHQRHRMRPVRSNPSLHLYSKMTFDAGDRRHG